jgi:hypothetical protein
MFKTGALDSITIKIRPSTEYSLSAQQKIINFDKLCFGTPILRTEATLCVH